MKHLINIGKANAAGLAKATAGRARSFKTKKDKLDKPKYRDNYHNY